MNFEDAFDNIADLSYWVNSQILFPKLCENIFSDRKNVKNTIFSEKYRKNVRIDYFDDFDLNIEKIIGNAKNSFETVWNGLFSEENRTFDLQNDVLCPSNDFFGSNQKLPFISNQTENFQIYDKNGEKKIFLEKQLKKLFNALKSDFSPRFNLENVKIDGKAILTHVSALRSVSFSVRMAMREKNRPVRISPLESSRKSINKYLKIKNIFNKFIKLSKTEKMKNTFL